jgi:hypothetical protein
VPWFALLAGRFASIEAKKDSLGYLQCRQNDAMADSNVYSSCAL